MLQEISIVGIKKEVKGKKGTDKKLLVLDETGEELIIKLLAVDIVKSKEFENYVEKVLKKEEVTFCRVEVENDKNKAEVEMGLIFLNGVCVNEDLILKKIAKFKKVEAEGFEEYFENLI